MLSGASRRSLAALLTSPQCHAALQLGLGGPLPLLAASRPYPFRDANARGWFLNGEVNDDKTKYVIMSRIQFGTELQRKYRYKVFEKVVQFKYLGISLLLCSVFGTECFHVIVVSSTLSLLPSNILEPSFWLACPATSNSVVDTSKRKI